MTETMTFIGGALSLLATPGPTNTFDSLVWPNVDADSQADSIQIRLGIEYVLIRSRLKVPLRARWRSFDWG